jgi:NDP-sugar pyrophosphorylase family protein
MNELTQNTAKPALSIGSEKIITRLVRQVSQLDQVKRIFVNCSHQAFSIVDALKTTDLGTNLVFLWEKEYMGTAWSVATVYESTKSDILTIHGDLLLSKNGLLKFIKSSSNFGDESVMAFHKRNLSQARSILELERDSAKIRSFVSYSSVSEAVSPTHLSETILSNSGIYLFRSHHLELFERHKLSGKDITSTIIPKLVEAKVMVGQEFFGSRLSIENPEDLRFAQENIFQFN